MEIQEAPKHSRFAWRSLENLQKQWLPQRSYLDRGLIKREPLAGRKNQRKIGGNSTVFQGLEVMSKWAPTTPSCTTSQRSSLAIWSEDS